jgi:hypothetical protein
MQMNKHFSFYILRLKRQKKGIIKWHYTLLQVLEHAYTYETNIQNGSATFETHQQYQVWSACV